jgi:hypothetical protein
MRTTGPGQPAQLLLDALELLNQLGVPHAIIGAFAVAFYGVPRFTDDADAAVWLGGTPISGHDLVQRLSDLGYRAELRKGDPDDPISVIILIEDQFENRVDLILGIRGMDSKAVDRCTSGQLLDCSVRILGAEDLIAMKLFAGGVQDLEDVRGILQVSSEILNVDLMRRLALKYDAAAERKLDELLTSRNS